MPRAKQSNQRDKNRTIVTSSCLPSIYIICRPSPAPSVEVPLGARSVCWAVWPAKAHEDRQIRPWVKLLWCVRGQAKVRAGAVVYDLPPESVAVFFPGKRHEAWAGDEEWEVRWLTLDGPLCAAVTRGLGFSRAGVYRAGPAPVAQFEALREAISDPAPASERRADALAYAILVSASLVAPQASSLIDEAKAQLQRHWASTDFGIEALATELGIHRSRLSRLFRQAVGVSPVAYLIDLRMRAALNLLKATDMTVAEIAHRCGYNDTSHFCRVFRALRGQTPGDYRAS